MARLGRAQAFPPIVLQSPGVEAGASVAGDVSVTVAVDGGPLYNLHPTISGNISTAVTVAGTMIYSATLAAVIVGDITVSADPAASTLDYNQHPLLVGAVSVVVTGAAGLEQEIQPSFVADTTVQVTVGAGFQRNIHPTLVGGITVGIGIEGTVSYHRFLTSTASVAPSMRRRRRWLVGSP